MTKTLEMLRISNDPLLTGARERDAKDPLLEMRSNFDLPNNLIYLDGNSLGAMPVNVPKRLQRAVLDGWRTGLVQSWNELDRQDRPNALK